MSAAISERLTHREIERIRSLRGRSLLFFITDRCPVGCGHCSVDSRPDGPTVADFELFAEIVGWIVAQPDLAVIGISGGEPFVERRGLELAIDQFAAANRQIVVFTSGIWAAAAVPRWTRLVLNRVKTVYLSTDAFHATTVSEECFVRATRAIAEAGAWLIVQTVDEGDGVSTQRARNLLALAFGPEWPEMAELNTTVPLLNGRGASVFERLSRTRGHAFGPCSLVRSPMIRYDGVVTGCCNESIIVGKGPSRLRYEGRCARDIDHAVSRFHSDPLLRAIGDVGLGLLTHHPRFADLAQRPFSTNCDLCWEMLERMPDEPDRLIEAISALGGER